MNPQADLRLLSRIALATGGALLLGALVIYLTAPAMLPMGSSGWFAAATAYQRQTFVAAVCGMLGIAALFAGLRLTHRLRDDDSGHEPTVVLARGFVSTACLTTQPSAIERLEHLETMRRRGLIDSAEYASRRTELLDDL
jgi:hypothetical protein